ncbi:hypothetical protein K505DRAFT_334796 [Melanomma pulvis-pyrius CBS 109.77]|uniref:Uncharacterized protein n=1 Tax=Melanomma pulvis-pyrius CBS 109.77 TaxID=1314802 RepID=A0A6A6XK01_9PLEO|nr:hypothetical protein K505DRAFT_334796 [Melanomma pulvis-pyrius CBS 109.77]
MGLFGRTKDKKAKKEVKNPPKLRPSPSIYQAPGLRPVLTAKPVSQIQVNHQDTSDDAKWIARCQRLQDDADRYRIQAVDSEQRRLHQVEELRRQLQASRVVQEQGEERHKYELDMMRRRADVLEREFEIKRRREKDLLAAADDSTRKLAKSRRELDSKTVTLNQKDQELNRAQEELHKVNSSLHSTTQHLNQTLSDMEFLTTTMHDKDMQYAESMSNLSCEREWLKMEREQYCHNFDQATRVLNETTTERDHLRNELRDMKRKTSQVREETEILKAATNTLDTTKLELNRTRNDLRNATREAQQAKEEAKIKDRRMAFVQQQCAILQDKLSKNMKADAKFDNPRRHTLGTMVSAPMLKGIREHTEETGKLVEREAKDTTQLPRGPQSGAKSKDVLKMQNRRTSQGRQHKSRLRGFPEVDSSD